MENVEQLTIIQMLGIQWGMNLLRYLSIAGGTYLIVFKFLAPKLKQFRHNKNKIKIKDLRRELGRSLLSTFIFLIPSLVVIFYGKKGVFKVSNKLKGNYRVILEAMGDDVTLEPQAQALRRRARLSTSAS